MIIDRDIKEVDENRDRVAEQFENRTIFITGGTGFVGKVFIEKILRLLNVKKIFVLIRKKKGKSAIDRFEEMFKDPLFDLVKQVRGKQVLDKICFIHGDCSLLKLGLSDDDRSILTEEVEYIYHCAASIRFDEPLKSAVLLNVRGTKLMLELAEECRKLLVFCYLSTSYCHLGEDVVYEKVYPPPSDPNMMIKVCELMNDEVVDSLSSQLLKEWPNTYAFTKALAEGLVTEKFNKLPIVLLRPSMIMPIWIDPIPGWTDNLNGPMGLLIAAGKGVLRTMYVTGDAYADYVPVDIVANSILATTTQMLLINPNQHIYNISSSEEYRITFEEIIETGRRIVYTKLPFNGVFWYPGGGTTNSLLRRNFIFFTYQWIPAVLVDILLVILRYPPVLKRVQRRIWKGYEVFEYYANRKWDFSNEIGLKARERRTKKEKELYKLDSEGLDLEEYFYNCIHAARLYLLKESDESIPAAKRHMIIMWWVDKIWMTFLKFLLFYVLWLVASAAFF